MVTYEEWLLMPEVSDAIEEVVNGEIRIFPVPPMEHSDVVDELYYQMLPHLHTPEFRLGIAPFGLVIRRHPPTVRVADLTIFIANTIVVEDGYVHSAPQSIVEVLTPAETLRDQEKLVDYAAPGVPEVWVVSPEARTVEVLYLEDGRLRRALLLAEGVLTPRHFPNVHVNVAEIWPD